MTALIAVCHGIFSEDKSMESLVRAIGQKCSCVPAIGQQCSLLQNKSTPPTTSTASEMSDQTIHSINVYNHPSDWKQHVLIEGINLASEVCARSANHSAIILVGHSQGGLACRIAAAALCDHDNLLTSIQQARGYADAAYRKMAIDNLTILKNNEQFEYAKNCMTGLIMLATPNSGAFTFGQLSIIGKLFQKTSRVLFSTYGAANFDDLTTDRLFRILQRVRVEGVHYLSISGSSINRFSTWSYEDLSELPVVNRLGVQLTLPNDSVVEDVSTDIRNAVLPPEIADIHTQYEHVRWYIDCTNVSHKGIHGDPQVHRKVCETILGWMSKPRPPKADL